MAILAIALIPIDHAATTQVAGPMLSSAITSGGDDAEYGPPGTLDIVTGAPRVSRAALGTDATFWAVDDRTNDLVRWVAAGERWTIDGTWNLGSVGGARVIEPEAVTWVSPDRVIVADKATNRLLFLNLRNGSARLERTVALSPSVGPPVGSDGLAGLAYAYDESTANHDIVYVGLEVSAELFRVSIPAGANAPDDVQVSSLDIAEIAGLGMRPGGAELYVLSGPDKTVYRIDRPGAAPIALFTAAALDKPEGIAVEADGTRVHVLGEGAANSATFDVRPPGTGATDVELDPRIPPIIDLCAVDDPARSILRVGPGEEFTTLQAAADQAAPGTSICMRGGVYTNAENAPFASLDSDGTERSPIFVGPLPGEVVVLQGTGTEAAWDDATFQEWEDGDRNMAFIINGDHWIVSGFEIRYLNRGIRINGDYNTVIGVHGHNFWESAFDMGRDPTDATLGPDLDVVGNRYALIHSEFCRHCSGISFGPQGNEATLLQDNTFEFVSGGFHGYEPDGDKVPPVPGDSAGGGNSDMMSGGKECSDGVQDDDFTMANGETDNICRNTTIRYVIGWHNADDSFDLSPNGVTFMANIGFNPGPEGNKGLKNLRPSFGSQDYFANLMVGGEAGDSRGFEARYAEPLTRWINNAAYANDNQGFIFSFADGVEPGPQIGFENNVAAANGQAFTNVFTGAAVDTSNTDAERPMLNGGDPEGFSLDAQGPRTMPPRERWNQYYQQFASYFRPAAGSPLVDAGVFVAGVHCDRADDDPIGPYPESDLECIHWRGAAPDQGPFESVD